MQKRINEQEDEAIKHMRAPEQVERLTKDVQVRNSDGYKSFTDVISGFRCISVCISIVFRYKYSMKKQEY